MRAYVRIRSSKASPPNSGRTVERLWSRAEANARNCKRGARPRKPHGYLRAAAVGCARWRPSRDGKEALATGLPSSPPCEGGGRFPGFAKRSSPANPKARRTRLDTSTDWSDGRRRCWHA
jgi:hypothetical protein